MSFVKDIFGGKAPQAAAPKQVKLLQPATLDQAQRNYEMSIGGIDQQQQFLNQLAQQGGIQNQQSVFDQLQQIAQGQGPNPALAQLNQATGQNVANQAALLASQRGASVNPALIGRLAAQAGSNAQQQAAGQAATLQANQSLAALNQLGGIAGQQVGQQQQGLSTLNQLSQQQQGQTLGQIQNQNQLNLAQQQGVNQISAANANAAVDRSKSAFGGLLGGIASAAGLGAGKAEGGTIDGAAIVPGDSPKNDIVPAMLSPGEIVIPRSVLESKDPVGAAAQFVAEEMKKNGKPKSAFNDGGTAVIDEEIIAQPEIDQGYLTRAEMDLKANAQMARDRGIQVDESQLLSEENKLIKAQELAAKDLTRRSEREASELKSKELTDDRKIKEQADFYTKQGLPIPKDIEAKALEFYSKAPNLQVNPSAVVADNASAPGTIPGSSSLSGQTAQSQMTGSGEIPIGNQDPYGYGQYQDTLQKGINMQLGGIQGAANAAAAQAKAQADIFKAQQVELKNEEDKFKIESDKNMADVKAVEDDIKANPINANKVWNDMSTPAKIQTSIAVILGGLGAGLGGGENMGLKVLQSRIDRDLEAQRANQTSKQNLLGQMLQKYGNIKDAYSMAKATLEQRTASMINEQAAKFQDPIKRAEAQQLVGKLMESSAANIRDVSTKRFLLGGSQSTGGQGPSPEQLIRAAVPQEDRDNAFKELKEAQDAVRVRDNVLSKMRRVHELQKLSSRGGNPIQSKQEIDAIVGPISAELAVAFAGKFSKDEANAVKSLFSSVTTDDKTFQNKLKIADSLLSQKMNYPLLKAYGIDPLRQSKFGQGAQQKIQLGNPVTQ